MENLASYLLPENGYPQAAQYQGRNYEFTMTQQPKMKAGTFALMGEKKELTPNRSKFQDTTFSFRQQNSKPHLSSPPPPHQRVKEPKAA